METLKFSKVRPVRTPERGTSRSAGIDFFIPDDFKTYILYPGFDILIKSGIKVNIPKGYMLMAADKSGVVTSSGAMREAGLTPKPSSHGSSLIVGAKIVDEDYQGEIGLHLINIGRHAVELTPGMKIAQFILVPVDYCILEEVPENELFTEVSERGEGGWGSTNK